MKRILLNFYHLLKKHKVVALLNILGLSLAFTVILIVSIQVNYDYGYNSSIPNSDKVFQLRLYNPVTKTYSQFASCPLYKKLTSNIPEVEHIGMAMVSNQIFSDDDNMNEANKINLSYLWGTNSLLPIINPTIITGDTTNIAQRKETLLLTKSSAIKLFGTIDCIGKTLNKNAYQVNAVIEDFPRNNSACCDAICLTETLDNSWNQWNYKAFISIDPKAKDLVNSKLNGEGMPIDSSLIYRGERIIVGMDNVKDIYLSPLPEIRLGNPTTTLTLLSVGILVLLIALANLLNLAVALTPARMRMFNTQRVLGLSKRAQQIGIVFESIFFVILSFAISLCFLYVFGKTDLIRLFDASFDISYNIKLITAIGCGLIVFSILTGLYPAYYATSFPLATVLKGSFALSSHGILIRRILLTAQFAISITVLIIGVLIDSQHRYMQNKSWGINPEHVVYFNYFHSDTTTQIYYNQPIPMIDELLKNPNITDEAFAQFIPGGVYMGWGRDFEDIQIQVKSWPVSHNFLEFFGIELKLGETMKGFNTPKEGVCVVNETFANNYQMENPLTKKIRAFRQDCEIIGVAKDFNFNGFKTSIEPLVMVCSDDQWLRGNIFLKVNSQNLPATLDYIRSTVLKFTKEEPEIQFLDETMNRMYPKEANLSKIILLLSFISIFISLLGVYGLVFFNIRFKLKEIAIRRINGSSIKDIIWRLQRGFFIQITIASVIAVPVAYFFISNWLEQYPYQVYVNPLWFVIAILLIAAITSLSIIVLCYNAARINPVNTLKAE